jgi:hypothetical protein
MTEHPTTERSLTILDAGRATAVPARASADRVLLSPAAVAASLGWECTPEGLCRDEVCIPRRLAAPAFVDSEVDLAVLAGVLDRPLALDTGEGAAYLGIPAGDRRSQLASLRAPDFTLPDLHGRSHALSEHRGRKVFLVAYASW